MKKVSKKFCHVKTSTLLCFIIIKTKTMKTRIEIICNKKYQYFYDTNIRSWIVYEIDENGYQISDADYFSNKTQMIKCYNFKLTTTRGATR